MGRGWTGAIVVAVLASLAPIASAPSVSAAAPIARAWGERNSGELGIGSSSSVPRTMQTPVRNAANTADFGAAAGMDGGNDHAVWLKADGTVHAAGDDSVGQLGNGAGESDSLVPVQLSLTNVLKVDAGANYSVAIVSDGTGDGDATDGTVVGWGHNFNGQIGVVGGGNNPSESPIAIAGAPGDVIDVSGATGGAHTLAVKNDGTVWAWGANSQGQLGTTSACPCTDSNVPAQVVGVGGVGFLTGIVDVEAGTTHSVALASDASVYVWGAGGSGQIGDGTANGTPYATPVKVHGVNNIGFLQNVEQIAAGNSHNLARLIDGSVVGWGGNSDGQIGAGGGNPQLTPAFVLGEGGIGTISGIDDIAAGQVHSLAAGNGNVYAWGQNAALACQAGVGVCDSTDFTTPVQTLQLVGATDVAAGGFFSMAVADADTTAPTGTVEINEGAAATNDDDVTLGLTADDGTGAGVESMRFSNDGSSFSAWEAFATETAWQLDSSEGTKTVRAQFRDAVGNISTSFTDDITLDTTAPTGTIQINGTADYASATSVVLDLTADDGTGSGIDKMAFSDDGTTFTTPVAFNATATHVLLLPEELKTVHYRVSDVAGNAATFTDDITLDMTPPTVASFNPAGKKIGRTKNIVVTFSEEMATTSMTQATVTLKKGTRTIDTTLTFGDPTTTLTIDPVKRLKSGARYTVTLTIGVTDKAGIGLQAPVTKSYRVK